MPKAEDTVQKPLKRNQACQQCRRRKLKCDAVRPHCATCLRSHAAAKRAAKGDPSFPLEPECTWETPSSDLLPTTAPKTKYDRLESRIVELESLLQRENIPSESPASSSSVPSGSNYYTPSNEQSPTPSGQPYGFPQGNFADIPPFDFGTMFQEPGISDLLDFLNVDISGSADISWTNWPTDLPSLDIVRFLIDTVFQCVPLASRLLHRPTFLASLSHPPQHAAFPSIDLLHTLCALGSIYSSYSSLPSFSSWNNVDQSIFADKQIGLAKAAHETAKHSGVKLLQSIQSLVVMAWYYQRSAKWIEVYLTAGLVVRLAIPLGLNEYVPPSQLVDPSPFDVHVMPPPTSLHEMETRVNTWWCIYAFERLQMGSPQWAMSIDDSAVTQVLPTSLQNFELKVSAAPDRQDMVQNGPDILMTHSPDLTDSFTLYVKASILISRIRKFQNRSRTIDQHPTPEFRLLEHLTSSFRMGFPRHLRDPTIGNAFGQVDVVLYAAHAISLYAIMLLHEPFARPEADDHRSAKHILTACRATLDLIYSLGATSFDFTLLDAPCSMCFFHTGRLLVEALRVRIRKAAALDPMDIESVSQAKTETDILRIEINAIRLALNQMGQRLSNSSKHVILLDNLLAEAENTSAAETPKNDSDQGIVIRKLDHVPSYYGVPEDGYRRGLRTHRAFGLFR